MAGHGDEEETKLMPADRQQQVLLAADREQHDHACDRERLHHQHPFVRQERPRLEHQHPGQEIERQWQHPEQRRGSDVGRNMRGDGDQEARGHRGEKNPARAQGPTRRRRGRFLGPHVGLHQCRRAQQQHAAAGDQHDQKAIARGPHQVLCMEREHRLQQHRIGQQREETADIGGGIEEIRIGPGGVAGADEPGLQQRIVGGKRKERQPDRDGKQAEQPDGITRGRRIAPAGRDRQRQRRHRHDQQEDMDRNGNDAFFDPHQDMRVGIAGQEQRLEKHHRHRPHRGRAAEPRQHHLGEQRLHREQEQRAQEDRGGIDRQHQPVARGGRLVFEQFGRGHENSGEAR
jgi:hypothetical protein